MSSAEASGVSVNLTVNGSPTTVAGDPDTPLLHVRTSSGGIHIR